MSHAKSSTTSPKVEENFCVNEKTEKHADDTSFDKSTNNSTNDHVCPDVHVDIQLLKKDVGFTSTAFIGPAFPPEFQTTDLTDSLSEFYKEIEKIDATDEVKDIPEKQDAQLPTETPTSMQILPEENFTRENDEVTNRYKRMRSQPHVSWSHWYQNEPYPLNRARPQLNFIRSGYIQTQRHSSLPESSSRQPQFYHPPFHPQRQFTTFTNPHFPSPRIRPSNPSIEPSERFHSDPTQYVETSQIFNSSNKPWEPHHPPCGPPPTYPPAPVLILMRGLPGSGKSTLARELLFTGPSGVILSTDDYFAHRGSYHYDPDLLRAAHDWNQNRADDAMHDGCSPVIIDNTNLQAWEMKPYVRMALEKGYKVDFYEANTPWKYDPAELEKRNKHGVSQEKIARMLDRFSYPISVAIVMNSRNPSHLQQQRQPENHK